MVVMKKGNFTKPEDWERLKKSIAAAALALRATNRVMLTA